MDFPHSYEQLGERLTICVSPQHKFGTDAFLLSDFAAPRRKDIICDLGTGCGIVALLLYRNLDDGPKMAYCVDIQPNAIQQLSITVEKNSLHGKVQPILSDINKLSEQLPPHMADVVTCNPPYKIEGRGVMSASDSDKLARHETACTMPELCAEAQRLLKFGGRFCICQRPERLPDVLEAMRKNGLEPKKIRFVQQKSDTAPWLFLAEGRKGGKPFLQVLPPLIIEGDEGFSEELKRIYMHYLKEGN